MQKTLDPDRVRTIVAGAHRHARRLEWRLRLPRGEHEDLAQDARLGWGWELLCGFGLSWSCTEIQSCRCRGP